MAPALFVCLSTRTMTDLTESRSGDEENQDWKTVSGPRLVRKAVDRGSLPEGAMLMQKEEISVVINRIIQKWTPEKEM